MPSENSRLRRVGWFYCAPDWSWECHGSSLWPGADRPAAWNYDLWTVLEGKGTFHAPQDVYTLRAGDCFILQGRHRYEARHDPENPLVVAAVHFDYIDQRGEVCFPHDIRLHRRIEHLEFFTHLLERLDTTWHANPRDEILANTWLHACLAEIERQDRASRWHGFKRRQAAAIGAICRRMRNHPEEHYDMDVLARELGCSRRHFYRLFKEIQGQSPVDYLIHTRLKAAQGLLHASSYSIARIAELTGYRDIYFFSRQFKQKTGLSPSAYRQK